MDQLWLPGLRVNRLNASVFAFITFAHGVHTNGDTELLTVRNAVSLLSVPRSKFLSKPEISTLARLKDVHKH